MVSGKNAKKHFEDIGGMCMKVDDSFFDLNNLIHPKTGIEKGRLQFVERAPQTS